MSSAALETIHVFLLNEGVEVWRPVQAKPLGNNRYQIVSPTPDDSTEEWEFKTGEVVRCRRRRLYGGECIVAYELAQRSA